MPYFKHYFRDIRYYPDSQDMTSFDDVQIKEEFWITYWSLFHKNNTVAMECVEKEEL